MRRRDSHTGEAIRVRVGRAAIRPCHWRDRLGASHSSTAVRPSHSSTAIGTTHAGTAIRSGHSSATILTTPARPAVRASDSGPPWVHADARTPHEVRPSHGGEKRDRTIRGALSRGSTTCSRQEGAFTSGRLAVRMPHKCEGAIWVNLNCRFCGSCLCRTPSCSRSSVARHG